ncbi:hypothetical protein ASPWEDRAFT_720818 [Aspergillus wentii DTO 134E9]|uniref:Uncharacterized protein n=1 Tax=Aspergillus wentii DTO 134E9 TaxID=1073089 RepID=A0A1L9R6S1_ASPWE|nr:uncharacterized protein ASPWEDRAFT_720818 [Aspergillus wentii DTO 134E9]KAI9926715.1 SMK killer toxin resistance protein [Aspergillus wentii]OJJ30622.1 hypothetical protein ASPWEDRAFT_720818 [Aspergillus wentii DTO 134E9]
MASFMENLWTSVFTPGPTPTLLVATNVTFAALQALLLTLLLATHSIHFIVLSFLSGALWWSINWFAGELKAVQEADQAASEKESARSERMRTPGAIDTESDTETETYSTKGKKHTSTASASKSSATAAAAGATLQPPEQGEARKRLSVSGESSSGYVSTDSEWEKVDESNTA